jgi:hypothetical protein
VSIHQLLIVLGLYYSLYELDAKRVITYYQSYQTCQLFLKKILSHEKDSSSKNKFNIEIEVCNLLSLLKSV